MAQLSIPVELDVEFNEFYDSRYVPALLKVPGVRSAARYRLEWTDGDAMPEYLAVYEVDGADVPKTEAWRNASVDCGWAEAIRPHLATRRHAMFRRLP
ncbi:DUF4286 family protein [Mesorhizobium amorphae]|uniref:DUF4286 family protein n=1 Tax=Mesorhizobium amorphae TaxID=71433 RepID=UPI00177F2147|nr:DUF4286 family protein [Mesorhizobium amorphae]